jgi:hypothetical protein
MNPVLKRRDLLALAGFGPILLQSRGWYPAARGRQRNRLCSIRSLGMPGKSGQPLKLWEPGFQSDNPQEFMDRYTDFHVQLMSTPPIDPGSKPIPIR